MKKLFLVMMVAGFVACNNSSENDKPAEDTAKKMENTMQENTTPDSTNMNTTPTDTSAVQK